MFYLNLLYNTKHLNKTLAFNFVSKNRHYWRNMDCIDLNPPQAVCGMTCLQRDLFKKKVTIPQLRIAEKKSNKILPFLKSFILKMEKFKPVFSNENNENEKIILLHPLAVKDWKSLPVDELSKENITDSNFSFAEIEINYENWKADEIFKAILSKEGESLTSYSKIGHIIHVNLRDHLLPYKQLIGEVLKDKIPGCKTVVNKSQSIENTYRNFNLELICGEENYCVETKENGIAFQFDFSKVYWNPRLSTEHERIVKLLKPNDILYDVFAGVGPFSIPAAKKKCIVIANDLNPESFKWLNINAKKNKCNNNIETFNEDGRDFILKNIKNDFIKRLSSNDNVTIQNIHITMNLPGMAVEFLNFFQGLLADEDEKIKKGCSTFPLIHVYCFIKEPNDNDKIIEFVEENAGYTIRDSLEGIYFVRNVAPNKDMYRVSFYLTKKILFQKFMTKRSSSSNENEIGNLNKKLCTQ